MQVCFEFSHRLRETLGVSALTLDLPDGADLSSALSRLAREMAQRCRGEFLHEGTLHPSFLIVMDGEVHPRDHHPTLRDGATVQLLLPMAGG